MKVFWSDIIASFLFLLALYNPVTDAFGVLPSKVPTLSSSRLFQDDYVLTINKTILYMADADNADEAPMNDNNNDNKQQDNGIDVSSDDRLYSIQIPRATGIEWGTDLSFSFVYVRDLDPSGPAFLSGKIEKGDQLCQFQPVTPNNDGEIINLVGASFDYVMNAFAGLDRKIQDVNLVFFRGTKDELKAAASGSSSSKNSDNDTITVTVIQRGKSPAENKVTKLTAPAGVNVRKLLTDNNINVYQSVTRWTNCKGKQLCGTCIVNITEGAIDTNRKSMDEESTLRENPESYRLSCITFAYGDITVETFPPINAAQWTR